MKLKLSVIFMFLSGIMFGQQQEELSTKIDSVSYSVGVSIGESLKNAGLTGLNHKAFNEAVLAALNGKDVRISMQDGMQLVNDYLKGQKDKEAITNKKEGEAFLEANKKKKGVKVTESGIQYIVQKQGEGLIPVESDKVKVHYHGTLIDGTVFDSSVDRGEPTEFPVKGVITGWQEILQLMPVGSKWKVFIPTELAYGEMVRPGGPIGPNMALVFEIELLDIIEQEVAPEDGE